MYRISVTTLEKFRRCALGLTSYDTEEALIQYIKGLFMGNDKTRTGEAYHSIIEGCSRHNSKEDRFYVGDFVFTRQQAAPALQYIADHPFMVHEVPVKKVYDMDGYSVLVSGRVDGMEGRNIHDSKTRFRAIETEEYMESYQWRYYLDITGLDHFFYDVFEVTGFDSLPYKPPFLLSGVQFNDPVTIPCDRYFDLHEDCKSLLQDFMKYIETKKFFHLLKQTNETVIL